jgi:hypothetical protein
LVSLFVSAVSNVITNSAVAVIIYICFPWVPAVVMVSVAAGSSAPVVVLTAVDVLGAVA